MMGHLLCCIHNLRRQPLADVLVAAVVAVAVGVAEQAVGAAVAGQVVDVVVVAAVAVVAVVAGVLVEADGPLVQLHLAAYMIDKCGSTTAYIVLHNSMDYYMLDIGSFKFLLPLKGLPIMGNWEKMYRYIYLIPQNQNFLILDLYKRP